jgi:hypothetical protein
MMTPINVLGVAVNYDLPTSLQEALLLPGCTEDLIFKSFLKQNLYHGSLGAIRAKITELLEARELGKRESYLKKKLVFKQGDGSWLDASGKTLTTEQVGEIEIETDARFFLRTCAINGVDPKSYTELVQEATNLVPFDVTRKERGAAGEKKASKKHLSLATEIADNGALDRVALQLGFELGFEIDVSGDRDEAISTLALAIGENERREADQRKNKYLNLGA